MSRTHQAIEAVRALMERNQFAQALGASEAMLREAPENREALYLVAVSQRYLRRLSDALGTLDRLEALAPDYGRLYQERGHCYRTLLDARNATAAYAQAVALNPALQASWAALAELHQAAGRAAEAARARQELIYLSQLPPALLSAMNLMYDGELYKAEQLCRQLLQKHPTHIEGMRLLAALGVKLNVLDDAEFLLESVVEFTPQHYAARFDYATVLSKRQKYAKALEQARILRQQKPGHRAAEMLYATQCVGLGDHAEGIRLFQQLLAEKPDDAEARVNLAHALKTVGRQQESIDAYRAAFSSDPEFGGAYWSLANLKTYRFTDDELTRMRLREATTTRPETKYHLCFALGKALEDRGEYEQSFQYYSRGNTLKREESRYRADRMERDLRLQREICTAEFFAARTGAGCGRPDPIFIVGLPRAGSTLLEQILASHSKVEGTMELHDIVAMSHELDGRRRVDEPPRYPACLAQLGLERFRELGEKYIADTMVYRTGKPFFIDKMPNNFRHIGLIHLILPHAKIIDARRDAMACCFSNFKQLFAAGQEFTYGLAEIGRYYRNYIELMDHWNAVLPGKVLRVQHEDVVADLESSVRRILGFCNLEFEPACLEFHKTERSVRTASSEQVRRPIYREGLDQWRNFAPWLGPLREALGSLAAQ
ncbi:MAG: sulfotransferase [Steroidobacteraceae bacterium]